VKHCLFINNHPYDSYRQVHTEADLRAHEQNVVKAAAKLAKNEEWRKQDKGGMLLERLTPIRSGGSWSWRFADSRLILWSKSGAWADFDSAPTVCMPCSRLTIVFTLFVPYPIVIPLIISSTNTLTRLYLSFFLSFVATLTTLPSETAPTLVSIS
jgi:hypothetical protein